MKNRPPMIPKRAMVWKGSHIAVGCNHCAWIYEPGGRDKGVASLQKAFEKHTCEQYLSEERFKADC